jgi:hypothetical protein
MTIVARTRVAEAARICVAAPVTLVCEEAIVAGGVGAVVVTLPVIGRGFATLTA